MLELPLATKAATLTPAQWLAVIGGVVAVVNVAGGWYIRALLADRDKAIALQGQRLEDLEADMGKPAPLPQRIAGLEAGLGDRVHYADCAAAQTRLIEEVGAPRDQLIAAVVKLEHYHKRLGAVETAVRDGRKEQREDFLALRKEVGKLRDVVTGHVVNE